MARHHACDRAGLPVVIAALMGMAAMSAGHAETGSANAGDLSVHVGVLGVAEVNIDPQAPAGFTNATDPTYDENGLPSYDNGGTIVHVSTGTISSEAQYSPGVSFSIAGSEVDIHDFSLSAVSLLGDGLLSITAHLIHGTSQVAGYCLPARHEGRSTTDVGDTMFFSGFDVGNLITGDGNGDPDDVTFDGLGISILGIPVPDLPDHPPPNTAIDLGALGIAGATLVLNEQVIGGDGVNMASQSTNAIHLTLDLPGVVSSDVTLAHSDSALDCTQ